jgi:hypothetical protein
MRSQHPCGTASGQGGAPFRRAANKTRDAGRRSLSNPWYLLKFSPT